MHVRSREQGREVTPAINVATTSRVELPLWVTRPTCKARSLDSYGMIGGWGQILLWKAGCFKGWVLGFLLEEVKSSLTEGICSRLDLTGQHGPYVSSPYKFLFYVFVYLFESFIFGYLESIQINCQINLLGLHEAGVFH